MLVELEHSCSTRLDLLLDRVVDTGLKYLKDADKKALERFGIFLKKDKKFMVRLRIPAGELLAEQAMVIGEVSKLYAEDYLDFTVRQEIELRYVALEDLSTLLNKLADVGISTFQTGGVGIRNITTSIFNAIKGYGIVDVLPLIQQIEQGIIEREEYLAYLPNYLNVSFLGSCVNDCNLYGNDCAFAVTTRGDKIGFRLYLGGGDGAVARDTGLFIALDEVLYTFWVVVDLYSILAKKREQLSTLLRRVGWQSFLRGLEKRLQKEPTLTDPLVHEPFPITLEPYGDALTLVELSTPLGLFSGSALIEVATEANSLEAKIRISQEQSLYWVVSSKSVKQLKNSLIYRLYEPYGRTYFNHHIASTSQETVAFSSLPNKINALAMANFLEREVPLPKDAHVRIYWSSCAQGYGLHDIADIGLESWEMVDTKGVRDRRFNLYLGGKVTTQPRLGRLIAKGITFKEAQQQVKRFMERYRDYRYEAESFEAFESRLLSV